MQTLIIERPDNEEPITFELEQANLAKSIYDYLVAAADWETLSIAQRKAILNSDLNLDFLFPYHQNFDGEGQKVTIFKHIYLLGDENTKLAPRVMIGETTGAYDKNTDTFVISHDFESSTDITEDQIKHLNHERMLNLTKIKNSVTEQAKIKRYWCAGYENL